MSPSHLSSPLVRGAVFAGLVGIVVFLVVVLPGYFRAPEVSFTGFTMGSHYRVQLARPGLSDSALKDLRAGIEARLKVLNDRFSLFDPASEVCRFNAAPPGPVEVSRDLADIVSRSLEYSRLSLGAFDITVAPLVELWGFGRGAVKKRPSAAQISAALDSVGYLRLKIPGPGLIEKTAAGVKIDLGAVAQGYAADAVERLLGDRGLSNYLIDIGGEMICRGKNPGGGPWTVGIQTPGLSGEASLPYEYVLEVRDRALATSGDYRNGFEEKGVRYSHIIDPLTGSATVHRLCSVTVIARDAATADALATAAMVFGQARALDWLKTLPEVDAVLFIHEKDGLSVQTTPGLDLRRRR